MYSNPSYDPNPLASHNQAVEQKAWDALNSSPGKPLLAAAYRQRFFPGSTFKIVTAAAVYDHKPAARQPSTSPSRPVLCCRTLLTRSCTTSPERRAAASCWNFSRFLATPASPSSALASERPGSSDEAHAFGWDQTPPLDLPGVAQSSFPPGVVLPRQPGRPGQVRHRPGERPGHTPDARPGRGRRRQRGRDHDAAPTRQR